MESLKSIAHFEGYVLADSCSLNEALKVMQTNKDGCVVLVKNFHPVGFLTESDLVHSLGSGIDFEMSALSLASKKLVTLNENLPIDTAFDILSEHAVRRIILVDANNVCKGIVFQEDLFDYLEEDVYKVDLRISHIIKPNQKLITLHVSATLQDALHLMQNRGVGSIIIIDDTFVGIITEKDILRLTYNKINLNESVHVYMTTPLISIEKNALVTDAIDLMRSQQIRRIIIHDENRNLNALLTNRDILKHIKGNYTRILQIKIKHAQEIMDFLPEAIIEVVETESYFMIHWMNLKAKEFFGVDLLEHSLESIIPHQQVMEIINEIELNRFIENIPLSIGSRNYDLSGILSNNLNNRYIKLIFKDVSEHELAKKELKKEIDKQIQKRLEHEYLLMQRSKLATMGEMIGHIAHQWRQPLAELGGIFMNLDATNKFDELDEVYLDQRIRSGNKLLKHMSHTIDDFRNFFEPNRNKINFQLKESIRNVINIIRASLTFHHIGVECYYPEKEISILGNPSEFSQVILNLLVNAKDVLLERNIKDPSISLHVREEANTIIIEINDNAGGISEELIDDVFEIYFTTKKNNEGTGIGLYMSRLIIESKFNGILSVFNDDKGACFRIVLL
jgi:signal transduction histidine kinase/CBS domain-containing protein